MEDYEVLKFRPDFAPYFKQLNEPWIREVFGMTAKDANILENPKSEIIDKGGEIFFAVSKGSTVGCCALIFHNENEYELAKMAVHPVHRKRGMGEALARSIVQEAKSRSAKELFLLTSTQLGPAIELYNKLGFKIQESSSRLTCQELCNMEMKLLL